MSKNEIKKDKLAFLYEKYKYLMMKVAYDILKDYFLAEDAVHNSFVKISKRTDMIDISEELKTKNLMVIICRNESIDLWRKRKKQSEHEESLLEEDNIIPLERNTGDFDGCSDLSSRIEKLPDKYKDVLILRYVNEMDDIDIAGVLNITEANVRKRISRGKQMLKNIIKDK